MDNLKLKKEDRAEKEKEFEALVEKAKKSALTDDETKKLGELDAEIESLDKEIETLEKVEARAKKVAEKALKSDKTIPGAPQDDASEEKELNKMGKNFRIAKAFKTIQARKNVDGVEAEFYQEALKEAQAEGQELTGNVAIPSKFIKIGKTKLLDVATEGTDTVFTDYGGLIPILNPDPIAAQLGVNIMSGLRGNVQWPRNNGDVAFAWEGETDNTAETTPTFNNVSITPKRVAGYVDVSMQMLKQNVFVLESWLRNALNRRYELTVDYAVLDADGTGSEPTGLLWYNGVNVTSLGSSGGDMTYGALLEMIKNTKAANARNGKAGWVTNANGEFALANTPRQASGVEGNFIYNMNGSLIGRPFRTTEMIPSDFSEGGQSDLVGIIYSPNWSSAILGTWGGMDILFDPYTQAVGGKVRFVCNAFMDFDVEQPAEFSICKDWDATDAPAAT